VHRDFDAARRAHHIDRDPVTFTLGGDTFTVLPDPTLGDTFDLADAPDIKPEDFDPDGAPDLVLVRVLRDFIRRMLDEDERPRFDRAMYRIPSTEAYVIVECAMWITEQVTGFPTEPPASSSSGRPPTRSAGARSKRTSGGRTTSPKSRPAGRTR
jgi:hypothetical protein